jgi:hypothetical protein
MTTDRKVLTARATGVARHTCIGLVMGALLVAAPARSQTPPDTGTAGANVEFDPIRCWWRTSAGAVRTGETFSVIVTCAVLETAETRAVPDETKLSPAIAQFPPFEVVSGSHPGDVVDGQRRFFQYEYVLRAINPDLIGTDVPLPVFQISYRIESRLPGNAAQLGRDLSYLLPPQQVRVLSTVPAEASDIRDTTDQDLARIEALRSRAGLFRLAAAAFGVLGVVMAGLGVIGLARRGRAATRAGDRPLGEYRIAGLAHRELTAAQRDAEQHGWSDATIARAVAATRVTAAGALRRPVVQQTADPAATAGEGRLLSGRHGRRRVRTLVSSAVTAQDLAQALVTRGAVLDSDARQRIEGLQGALATFTAAQYSHESTVDRAALDHAAAQAVSAAESVMREHRWPNDLWRRWTTRTAPSAERLA